MLEQAIFKKITDDPTISAKLSKVGGGFHLYPLILPNEFPVATAQYAMTYVEIKQQNVYPALKVSTFQINCFAKTFELATTLANDLESCLADIYNDNLGGIFGVTYIQMENRQALYDDNTKMWYYVVDFNIKY